MSDRAIIEAVQKLSGQQFKDEVFSIECTVISVNEKERTCDCEVVSGKVQNEIPDVRLMTCVDDGFFLVPAIDSHVCVIVSKHNDPYVSLYSEVEKIVMRGGDFGGLVKVTELTQKINQLENQINTLKQILTTWIPVPSDGGGALKAGIATWAGQPIKVTIKKEIENTNVTHG